MIVELLTTFLEEIKREIRRQSSPWATRSDAADYCGCCPTQIDKAANQGKIKRYFREGTPMFKKSGQKGSLDQWIESGQMPKSRINRGFAREVQGKSAMNSER